MPIDLLPTYLCSNQVYYDRAEGKYFLYCKCSMSEENTANNATIFLHHRTK